MAAAFSTHANACVAEYSDHNYYMFSVFNRDQTSPAYLYDIASYCLINTSPYFTAIASGNSKMYDADTLVACAATQGLRLAEVHDGLGICHSLLRLERQPT